MNTIQRIGKNSAFLFISQMIVALQSFIFVIFIARVLGDAALGQYSIAIAFTSLFLVVLDLGYNTLLIREIAKYKQEAERYVSNTLTIRIILSFVVIITIITSVNLLNYPTDVKNLIYLFAISTILNSLTDIFKVTFRAFEKMEYEALISTLSNFILVSVSIALLFLGYGLFAIGFVFILSSLLSLIYSIWICKNKFLTPGFKFELDFVKGSLKMAIPLAILSVFYIVYVKADTIILFTIKGDLAAGWYTAAYSLIMGLKPIPQLLMNTLLPLMSFYHLSSRDSLKLVYEKAFSYLFYLGLPLSILVFTMAPVIVPLIYGNQFSPTIPALQILAWDIILIFTYGVSGGLLIAMRYERNMAKYGLITAVINIALNIVLIQYLSYIGASIATLITDLILLILYSYFISKRFHLLKFKSLFLKASLPAVAMVIIIYLLMSFNLIITIVLAIAVYFLLLFPVRAIGDDDIVLLKKLFERRKGKSK